MSDGDRGERSEVRLRRWLWPAIIFAVAVLSVGGIQHWIYYHEASSRAAAYSSDANYHITSECAVPNATPSCERDIDEAARENQRREYDLYSQKAMALWTGIMGAMAVVGIALSGVGIYLIWRTWDATREAAENSRKTFDAYVWKERAHLIFDMTGVHIGEDTGSPFRGGVSNKGLSPATVISFGCRFIEKGEWREDWTHIRHCGELVTAGGGQGYDNIPQEGVAEGWFIGVVDYVTLSNSCRTYFCFDVTHEPTNPSGRGVWRFAPTSSPSVPKST